MPHYVDCYLNPCRGATQVHTPPKDMCSVDVGWGSGPAIIQVKAKLPLILVVQEQTLSEHEGSDYANAFLHKLNFR